MTRIVILVERGFQDQEYCYMHDRSLEAGYSVDVACPSTWRQDGEEHHGLRKQVFGSFGLPAKITKTCDELTVDDYDAVLIPGGFMSPDILRMRPEVLEFVRSMFRKGKLVAAICHGPWVMISAGIMTGAQATCYASLKDDLKNAGATYTATPVQVFANRITGDHYNHNHLFMAAVVGWLNERQRQMELDRNYARAP